ncbi:hypothetical protein ABIA39_008911 [Nocardia sp. GAS34]|uniref:hypothetical protein n=1 Tax=unclassified Nocardia TaxID=2637762 RepID=UPI003D197FD4
MMGFVGSSTRVGPCRIERVEYVRPVDTSQSWRRVYLATDELPINHIDLCFRAGYHRRPVAGNRAGKFTHCLEWPTLLPTQLKELIDLLTEVLVLPTADSGLNGAVALDWYKIVDADKPSMQWENTEVGQLVHEAKYYLNDATKQRLARAALLRRLSDAVQRHPALNSVPYMVSVPGHTSDGMSTAEQIAADLAQRTDKILVRMEGRPRPERKGEQRARLTGTFTSPMTLNAPCVIVDDVYRSGETLREAARAARAAGAGRVYGLVAAKTRRS